MPALSVLSWGSAWRLLLLHSSSRRQIRKVPMKYAELKIQEALARIAALDRDVAVLSRVLESRDQADRKVIEEALETITTERRRAYADYAEVLMA
jgi:PIN domain nuclease of toxin-antitoxin system